MGLLNPYVLIFLLLLILTIDVLMYIKLYVALIFYLSIMIHGDQKLDKIGNDSGENILVFI